MNFIYSGVIFASDIYICLALNISSIDKENLDTENNIKKYVRDNRNKIYVVLNPKAFLVKNRQDNNIDNLNENKEEEKSILGKNIKIGKLI